MRQEFSMGGTTETPTGCGGTKGDLDVASSIAAERKAVVVEGNGL